MNCNGDATWSMEIFFRRVEILFFRIRKIEGSQLFEYLADPRGCLEVWLWLFFKVLFTQKSVPIIFFYFLKIIF